LNTLARGGSPRHERINRLYLAHAINSLHGGGVVSVMDMENLDATWLDFFIGMAVDLPKKQAHERLIAEKLREFERENVSYGKR
jgi:hypothetical protein